MRVLFGERPLVGVGGNFKPGMQCQFFEDIVNVAFHGVGCDAEFGGDIFIAQAFCNHVHYLPFSLGHPDGPEQVASPLPGCMLDDLREERIRHRGREHLGSFGHQADRLKKVIQRGILQYETRDSRTHKLDKFSLDGHKIHDDDLRVRGLFSHKFDDAQTTVTSQAQVEQDNVGIQFLYTEEGIAVSGRGNNLHVRLLFEHGRDAFTQQPIVFYEEDPNLFHDELVCCKPAFLCSCAEPMKHKPRYRRGYLERALPP